MSAIVSLNERVNRSQKRKFIKEAEKIAHHLEEVNTAFIWHLFNADPSKSYSEIYTHYLSEWNQKVNWLAATKKFKTVAIDVLFFERNYKPELFIK